MKRKTKGASRSSSNRITRGARLANSVNQFLKTKLGKKELLKAGLRSSGRVRTEIS